MGNNRNSTNIIDINGKRYDAVTGSYLGSSSMDYIDTGPRFKSVDGFRRVSRGTTAAPIQPIHTAHTAQARPVSHASQPAHAKPVKPTAAPPKAARLARASGVAAAPHAPQRAVTLMRGSVTKPVIKSPAHIKAHTRTDLLATASLQTVKPKLSYNSINPVRHKRAARMLKNPAISRYGSGPQPAAAPAHTVYQVSAPQPVARPIPQYKNDGSGPGRAISGDIRPAQGGHAAPNHPARPTSAAAKPLAPGKQLFEKALADAKSHEQTYNQGSKRHPKKRRHLLGYITASLVALLLVGFLVYRSAPSISLRFASYRAGLTAKLPSQEPSGYSYGNLSYQPGNVTVNFTSPQSSRQFSIAQKESNWDSQALLTNFVAGANTAYKTYQQAGRTVYVLANNTATWVDSGIWYTVGGNARLSSDQLLELASSM